MDKSKLIECINFFNKLQVSEEDVTTLEERNNGQFVVIASYTFEGKTYKTRRLFYKEINHQNEVKNPAVITNYFGVPVFWLDNAIHLWPKGKGEAEIDITIIREMINDGDVEFETFLKKLASNKKDGFIQTITNDGRPQQYGFNLENNNHWHDIINLIKAIIRAKGSDVDKNWYNRLVFNWQDGERKSLSPYLGDRLMITSLYKNILSIQTNYQIMDKLELLNYKKQIILQGPPGTGKTRMAKILAQEMLKDTTVDYFKDHEQFKIIQFHPSYTYEDFVRGIVAKPNEDGEGILYKTENKTLGEFAAKALANFKNHQKDNATINKEVLVDKYFKDFVDFISDKIDENDDFLKLTNMVGLISYDEDAFRYRSKNEGWLKKGNRMLFRDIIQAYNDGNIERRDLKKNNNLSGLARQHASYFVRVLNMFQSYLIDNHLKFDEIIATAEPLKTFVLIIDEINRANLSSVLGELIYALEYRGDPVESMYDIDGDRKIIIPTNLYIIGTMNTADRSVGHIDYAIRRRFAFVDVLPDKSVIKLPLAVEFFEAIEDLFEKHTASDFEKQHVLLGHSYFLADDNKTLKLKLKYEVLPILNEYLNDGVINKTEASVQLLKEISDKIDKIDE